MFITSHVLAGQLIGRALPKRHMAALGAGIASHLLMDAIPHWGVRGAGADERFLEAARRDGLLGLAAIGASVLVAPRRARPALLAATLPLGRPQSRVNHG